MGQVYVAICAVAAALAADGIGKDRRNDQQGFQFRGIDDVYNALAPLLAQHKLCMLPRVTERTCTERQTRNGGALFSVVVRMDFDLVSGEDGSKHTISTVGEAMDSGDKATNKAMSAAYKYAAFMAFAIPTEGSNHDADEATPDVAPTGGGGKASRGTGGKGSSGNGKAAGGDAKEPPIVPGKHHPSATETDLREFAVELAKVAVQYDILASWLETEIPEAVKLRAALKVPPSRPSAWPKPLRERLLALVKKDPAKFIMAFEQREPGSEG